MLFNWLLMNVNWKWITTLRNLINKTGEPIPKDLKEVYAVDWIAFTESHSRFVCLGYSESAFVRGINCIAKATAKEQIMRIKSPGCRSKVRQGDAPFVLQEQASASPPPTHSAQADR